MTWKTKNKVECHQFSSVQSLSRVRLFATPWIAACQAFLPTPRVYSNSCPSSRWCLPAILSLHCHVVVCLSLRVCVCISFCKIFHHIEFRAQLVPLWLNLNLIKCIFNGPVSKSDQSYSGELGVRTLMYLVGGTVHLEQQVARKVLLCAECCSESWRTSRQHWGRRACTWWTLCELKE